MATEESATEMVRFVWGRIVTRGAGHMEGVWCSRSRARGDWKGPMKPELLPEAMGSG